MVSCQDVGKSDNDSGNVAGSFVRQANRMEERISCCETSERELLTGLQRRT